MIRQISIPLISTILFAATTATANADEASDIRDCANAFRAATGEDISKSAATWQPRLFSPNRVEFPSVNVVCEIGIWEIVSLTHGSTIIIRDGWPIGNEDYYLTVKGRIESEITALERRVAALERIRDGAEGALKRPGGDPQKIQDDHLQLVDRAVDRINSESSTQVAQLQDALAHCNAQLQHNECPAPEQTAPTPANEIEPDRAELFLGDLNGALEEGDLERALGLLNDQSQLRSIPESTRSDLEQKTLSLVRPIPAQDAERNLQGYRVLATLNPESATYLEKIRQYESALAARNRELDISICRALMRFISGSVPRTIQVSDAEGYPNPKRWERAYVAEYVRPTDNTRWRYMCGISEENITWSTINDNGRPSLRWMNPNSGHETITFIVNDDRVIFIERHSDGSVRRDELPL